MNFIGIDVSQGKSNATLITEDFEKITFKFKHNKSGFKQLKDYISQDTIVIFETTGVYSNQLSRFLRDINSNFYELNPLEAKMRMDSLRRNKNDANDSLKLALLGVTQLDNLNRRQYSDDRYLRVKLLTIRYKDLIDQRTRCINKLHTLLEQSFPELNQILKPINTVTNLHIIRMYAHPDYLLGLTVKSLTDNVMSQVSSRIKRSTVEPYCSKIWLAAKDSYPAVKADSIVINLISDECDDIENYNQKINKLKSVLSKSATMIPEFKIICSVPGIGELSAAMFLGLVGDIRRFKTYKQLNAYVGIDINRYQSGKYLKKDKINRRGSKLARYVEFQMIRSMLRTCAQFKRRNHIVDYYYKLKEPPYQKHDLVALIACANHLNRTLMQLVRTNQLYDYKKASR